METAKDFIEKIRLMFDPSRQPYPSYTKKMSEGKIRECLFQLFFHQRFNYLRISSAYRRISFQYSREIQSDASSRYCSFIYGHIQFCLFYCVKLLSSLRSLPQVDYGWRNPASEHAHASLYVKLFGGNKSKDSENTLSF